MPPAPPGSSPSAGYGDLFHAAPVALLAISVPDLVMVEVNPAYLRSVGRPAEDIVGHHVFDVFPNSPIDLDRDQTTDLRAVFTQTIETRQPVSIAEMRYDIPRGDGSDGFEVRWWSLTETPIIGPTGAVDYLLHFTEDITELRRTRDDLAVSQIAERTAVRQVSSMAEVALALTAAQTVEDIDVTVLDVFLRVLGASGGAIMTRTDAADWRVTASATLPDELRRAYAVLPFDSGFPIAVAARTGERVLITSRAHGLAISPLLAEIYDHSDRVAFACLPLVSQGRLLGALQVSWDVERVFTEIEIDLLAGVAAQCATAVDRIEQADKQRRTAEQIRHLAEALQSAMLTPPPHTDGVEVAVRYRSANDVARVGGDWYDAFLQPDGDLMVVIGDVTGHDDDAAGKMGHVRGLLRALAYDDDRAEPDSPAAVLTRFERVSRGLEVDELSTAVLARIDGCAGPEGHRRMRWSNAGNPPPIVVAADGSTEFLEAPKSDLILGVEPTTPRTDLAVELAPGSTLLLYTDGLIERRDAPIDHGLDDLAAVLADLADAPLEELCDLVLLRLDPHTGEDDIAMVAVRV